MEEGEVHQWALGRYLVDVVDEFGLALRPEIIRQLSNGTGAHPSTLRDREVMCRFYSPDEQSEYPFSWSQFRALKSAGREHWREHAEYWVQHLPAPVSAIRHRIKGNGHLEPVWQSRLEAMVHIANLIYLDESAPQNLRAECFRIAVWTPNLWKKP